MVETPTVPLSPPKEKQKAALPTYYRQNRDRRLAYQAAYNASNRESIRAKQALRDREARLALAEHPGLPDAAMWLQASSCAICHEEPPPNPARHQRLHFDHDHATGAFRGWLCMSCNTALGKFRDDPAILQRAIDYLASPPATLDRAVSPSPLQEPQCP